MTGEAVALARGSNRSETVADQALCVVKTSSDADER
jgi:hypothetical protein